MLRVLPLLAAVPLVTAFLPYIDTVPDTVTTDDSCVFPEGYVIDQFTSWTPSASNNRSSFFGFGYTDQNTSVSTTCEWNSTSKAVIPGGASPRYACDNPLVEFIWENGTIDLIEKICVGSSGTTSYEVSGSVQLDLACVATACNSTTGDGTECTTLTADVAVNFTSLEPTPEGS